MPIARQVSMVRFEYSITLTFSMPAVACLMISILFSFEKKVDDEGGLV